MPRVGYAIVQQGFRPHTNPRPLAGLRGLGDVPSSAGFAPSWWDLVAPGVGGAYDIWQGIKLVFAPGDPTAPVLNVSNAQTGQLSKDQIAQIKQNAAVSITQAAGGNTPLAQAQIAAADAEIDSTLGQSIPTWVLIAGAALGAYLVAEVF